MTDGDDEAPGPNRLDIKDLDKLVPCPNWHMVAELAFVLSGCSPVLADQARDGVPALDLGSGIDGLAGLVQWRSLLPCLMGSVAL